MATLTTTAVPAVAAQLGTSAALPAADGTIDVPDTPSQPLPQVQTPVDQADTTLANPEQTGALPDPTNASVVLGDGWTAVPGAPIEVQPATPVNDTAEQPTPSSAPVEPDPSSSLTTPTPSATTVPSDAPTTPATTDPTSPAQTTSPADPAPTDSSSGSPSTATTAAPTTGDNVTVNVLDQVTGLRQGTILLQVQTDGLKAGSPSPTPGDPTPTPSPTDPPTPDPSPSGLISPTTPVPAPGKFTGRDFAPDSPSGSPSTDAPAAQPEAAAVDVRLSYNQFNEAFGGDWSDRLAVTAYPACYAVTPQLPECSQGVPVQAENDQSRQQLIFDTAAPEPTETTDPTETPDPTPSATPSSDPSIPPTSAPSSTPSSAPSATPNGAVASPALFTSPRTAAVSPIAAMTTTASSTGTTVYAISGGAGSYGSNPTAPSASWQVGTGSGDFQYAYNFTMPAPNAGTAPDLSIDYSSQTVDGMTTAQNGQASQTGLGWSDLNPGYISRSFASCSDDQLSNKGDLCWKTDGSGTLINEFDLVLNGQDEQLIPFGGNTPGFRLKDDPGWQVTYTSAASARRGQGVDAEQEVFKVTTPDGTQYWFGQNGDNNDSVWTVPVYGNDAGEPCHDQGTGADDQWCQQGWQFNLDKVIDPNGNVTKYYYASETNYYDRWANTSDAYRTGYDRGGHLSEVDYGFDRSSGVARDVVSIDTGLRCTNQMSGNNGSCTDGQSPQNSPGLWPDVPTDLLCSSSGSCTVGSPSFFTTHMITGVTTKTVEATGSGPTTRTVDNYALTYTMPDPDTGNWATDTDPQDLWLNKIQRTGHGGGGTLAQPSVLFNGTALQDKVAPTNGQRPFWKFRLSSVRTETGGRVDVTYGHADGEACSDSFVHPASGSPADSDGDGLRDPWNATKECFSQEFTPPGSTNPVWDWFNKYVVTRVALDDDALGYSVGNPPANGTALGQPRVYDYHYTGDPAWRFDNSKNIPDADETWGDWRGYQTTFVHTRKISDSDTLTQLDESVDRVVRFRGMDGSRKSNQPNDNWTDGQTALNTVEYQGTPAQQPNDVAPLDGLTAEDTTFIPDSSSSTDSGLVMQSRHYTGYDFFGTAHWENRDARVRYVKQTDDWTNKFTMSGNQAGDQWEHKVDFTVDDGGPNHQNLLVGTITQVDDHGYADDEPGGANDSTCTQTTWSSNPSTWIRDPRNVKTYGATCATVNSGTAGLPVRDISYVYDAPNSAISRGTVLSQDNYALTSGNLSQTITQTGTPGVNPILTENAYDFYGRPTARWDGNFNKTSYDYSDPLTPSSAGNLVTQVVTTDPAGNSTTSTQDPYRSQPVEISDVNGRKTDFTYDPIGRTTSITLPDNHGSGQPPNTQYTYVDSATSPSYVQTQTLRDGSNIFDLSDTFYDGWGRQVESQTRDPEDKTQRIVAVTGYDDQGQVRYQMPDVPNSQAVDVNTVLNPSPSQVLRYTYTNYDASQRPTSVLQESQGSVLWRTDTHYLGETTVVSPPNVGDTVTDYNAYGQPAAVRLIDGSYGTDTAADRADYTYDAAGDLTAITKTIGGNNYSWQYGYDRAGRQLYSSDPDTGAVLSAYDNNGNPTDQTQADGLNPAGSGNPWDVTANNPQTALHVDYNGLDQPIDEIDKTGGASNTLATWTYGTNAATNTIERLTAITEPVTGIQVPSGKTANKWTTDYDSYDGRGNVLTTRDVYPAWFTGETGNSYGYVEKTDTKTYNAESKPTGLTLPAEGNQGSLTLSYGYKADGSPAGITAGGVTVAGDTYNNAGWLVGINSAGDKDSGGITHGDLGRTYSHAANTGRLGTITGTITPASGAAYNPLTLAYNFNSHGDPTVIQGTTQTGSGVAAVAGNWCYSYDKLDRLQSARTGAYTGGGCLADTANSQTVTGSPYNLTYVYSQDRLSSVTPNGGSSYNYSYSAIHPHQTTAISSSASSSSTAGPSLTQAIGYDTLGRATSVTPGGTSPTSTTAYDHLGNPILMAPNSGTSASVRGFFGVDGKRSYRQVVAGGVTTNTVYRSDGTELTCQGDCVEDTRNANGALINGIARAVRVFSDPSGAPVAMKDTVGWNFVLADAQGSIRVNRASTGAVKTTGMVTRSSYSPFGQPLVTATNIGSQSPGGHSYLGKVQDASGDIRLDHRTYSAGLNVMSSPDPLLMPFDPQNLNPYSYSRNNPIEGNDPSGLVESFEDLGGTGGGGGGLGGIDSGLAGEGEAVAGGTEVGGGDSFESTYEAPNIEPEGVDAYADTRISHIDPNLSEVERLEQIEGINEEETVDNALDNLTERDLKNIDQAQEASVNEVRDRADQQASSGSSSDGARIPPTVDEENEDPATRAQRILKPDGTPIGEQGSNPTIRVLHGQGASSARELFDRLSRGGKVLAETPGKLRVGFPDGSSVNYRTEMSEKSPKTEVTLDVFFPGLNDISKVKFNP